MVDFRNGVSGCDVTSCVNMVSRDDTRLAVIPNHGVEETTVTSPSLQWMNDAACTAQRVEYAAMTISVSPLTLEAVPPQMELISFSPKQEALLVMRQT